MRLYVASSWKNRDQPLVVGALREAGHTVYDFRHPPEDAAFAWRDIGVEAGHTTIGAFREALRHPDARAGALADFGGIAGAEACVLVLPAGRSAHLEAGVFIGSGRPVYVLSHEEFTPELVYWHAKALCANFAELLAALRDGADAPPCGNRAPHEPHDAPPRGNPDDEGYDWCPGVP
jgi:hypothetical protein